MDEKRVATTVTIYGVEYRLRGPDEQFARDVAEMVDSRMHEVASRLSTASQTRIAVMALLNIAGELLAERRRREEAEAELGRRLAALGDRVESVLAGRGAAAGPEPDRQRTGVS
jgi:cell division protein ZapA (FtsZ GTPase activity inhibitor)